MSRNFIDVEIPGMGSMQQAVYECDNCGKRALRNLEQNELGATTQQAGRPWYVTTTADPRHPSLDGWHYLVPMRYADGLSMSAHACSLACLEVVVRVRLAETVGVAQLATILDQKPPL